VDFTELTNFLAAISSVAVIAGAGFVVLQLRQNAVILKATLRQERSNSAFSMLEKITHESFAKRRARMYEIEKRAQASNWVDFDNSEDDFEARNFAYLYELYGVLVQEEILEFRLTAETLKYLVVTDWEIFRPHSEHLMKLFGLKVSPWGNFEWLARKVNEYMQEKEKATS
jgi:hypothetical protein